MKIRVGEGINPYYAQTLAMLFFPGAKFPEDPAEDDGQAELTASLEETEEGYLAHAALRAGEKTAQADGRYLFSEGIPVSRGKKLALGRAVFAAGKELFGIQPPWGILTGVRPAKVAMECLASGSGIMKTRAFLRSEYFLSLKKATLCTGVAAAELKLKRSLTPDMCSVYISIPFCPSRCAYCSFVSYTTPRLLSLIDDYLDLLLLEIRSVFRHIENQGKKVASIYIGGGTPTILSEEQLKKLLTEIGRCTDVSSLLEFTLEAGRPDTINPEKLKIARACGVTRISVNPQSMSDVVLETIGRRHTVADFLRAYNIAVKSGIGTINVDLIAGLPGDNFTRFSRSLDRVAELAPQNVTVHSFCVKKSSDFLRESTEIYRRGGGDAVKCVDYSQLKLRNTGYKPYYLYRQKNTVGNLENVGFAKEGKEGIYNVVMMEEYHSVYGAGAGAVTRLVRWGEDEGRAEKIKRIINPKYPYEYLRGDFSERALLARLEEGERAVALPGGEELSPDPRDA